MVVPHCFDISKQSAMVQTSMSICGLGFENGKKKDTSFLLVEIGHLSQIVRWLELVAEHKDKRLARVVRLLELVARKVKDIGIGYSFVGIGRWA
ncbi:hypothetical protein MtrunA17_Chr5g0414701 [Medicago truncatula]|uniref:Uncharacterized protein n=1 Tax=Medicago truncatula TaxID=3880 RepID=A0A396HP97_MEDTR|nr:hypothetical protein MtrunA17_Chr5g0414701 [Medicago truncatula]